MRAALLLVLVTSCLSQKAFRSRRIGTEGQVISKLLTDYDPATRPPVRDNADHSSILVITNIFINRVTWHEHRAEVDLYLRQQWQDGRLQYDVDPREEIEQFLALMASINMPAETFAMLDLAFVMLAFQST
ncbi:hypothetical protein ANCCAN_28686 [Ancylostoma caninum]|uniref:Neurotransmitter-gated ion-channel ligand-binding domain-containing protein n=1 Tax=Ancylostoma caninum TaxID=29170 RepID=A0A368F3L9_ANCCA|nr:hypothetical protein ANCCAN_28686 [Ancylostoma caninum]